MKRFLFTISVLLVTAIGATAQSPYINRVYEYRPAPGQFVNEMPSYEEGDTPEDMARKAEECIAHDERVLISLGSYGGYVTFGFDHMIENRPGKMDFQILGNAFYSNANPNPNASKEGCSCEPGIVMVSHDANGNGEPDDAWYELAGSETSKPETIRDYKVTYYRPDASGVPVKWTDNMGASGEIDYLEQFHSQDSYYPSWIMADSYTLSGTLLKARNYDKSGNGSYWINGSYDWGYADNFSATDFVADKRSNLFEISNAIDAKGKAVSLPYIDFVKVQCAVNAKSGWLGEVSTEVSAIYDYSMKQ